MMRLAYTSRGVTPELSLDELASILEASDRNNTKSGVTGGLLIGGDRFFQVLEGKAAAVEATFDRIKLDRRHADIVPVWSGTVSGRLFERWAMVAISADPTGQVNIRRTIDEAADWPHGSISILLQLVRRQLGVA